MISFLVRSVEIDLHSMYENMKINQKDGDFRIHRPRQIYIGDTPRDYVELADK